MYIYSPTVSITTPSGVNHLIKITNYKKSVFKSESMYSVFFIACIEIVQDTRWKDLKSLSPPKNIYYTKRVLGGVLLLQTLKLKFVSSCGLYPSLYCFSMFKRRYHMVCTKQVMWKAARLLTCSLKHNGPCTSEPSIIIVLVNSKYALQLMVMCIH